MNWAHEQEKNNLSNLDLQIFHERLFKKVKFNTKMAIVNYNIIWIKKIDKLL
jgi:hypothetical protein